MSGGEYRDELGAALARIAELEEKLRIVTEEAAPKPLVHDGSFPDLEDRVRLLRKPADAAANARRRTIVSIVSALFPLAGMVFSFLHMPVWATVCSLIFILLVIYNFAATHSLKTSTKNLADAEAKLADARRIADLEAKLASANVRVAAQPEDVSLVSEDEVEPQRMAR